MVRMWNVEVVKLCDQHLLGEHNEMHMVVGTIRKHPYGEAVVKGHAKKGQLDTSLIKVRHDELAEEMVSRDMNHDTPLEYTDKLGFGNVDVEESRKILRDRCNRCRL